MEEISICLVPHGVMIKAPSALGSNRVMMTPASVHLD